MAAARGIAHAMRKVAARARCCRAPALRVGSRLQRRISRQRARSTRAHGQRWPLTTGLTGLRKSAAPHKELMAVYNSTLKVLQKMPANVAYRANVEALTNLRLQAVKKTEDIDAIEAAVDGGQIEEVIAQAKRELDLAEKMLEWKPWEPLEEQPLEGQWKWP